MRVLIAGIDGYIGYPLAHWLRARGHEVAGFDSLVRRRRTLRNGGGDGSVIPIASYEERRGKLGAIGVRTQHGDVTDTRLMFEIVEQWAPDAIIHLAEQPSAAWSMGSQGASYDTVIGNISGTLGLLWLLQEHPNCHLLKLGTAGEYGTPDIEITEGEIEIEFRGRKDKLPFPRRPSSIYHCSKVMDSTLIEFAVRNWGLRSTDVMQGVVYGTQAGGVRTRFDVDECFGTAINRFVAQACSGQPITIYGLGGQTRGWLPLHDSLECLTIALENPPDKGEYRVINQFERTYSINHLAAAVDRAAGAAGLGPVEIHHIGNPRLEAEAHYYQPEAKWLREHGYQPRHKLEDELAGMIADVLPHKDRIPDLSKPLIDWRR